jgi:hypothetical protein
VEIVAFDRKLDRSSFSCGKPDLDDWLKRQAGQQERANNTRTFLAVEGQEVVGYYAATTYRLGSMRLPRCSESGGWHIRSRPPC